MTAGKYAQCGCVSSIYRSKNQLGIEEEKKIRGGFAVADERAAAAAAATDQFGACGEP